MNEKLNITESPNSPEARCAYCHDSVSLENEYRCAGCDVQLHQDCCESLNECPTLGCGVALPQRQSPHSQVGSELGSLVGAVAGSE